MTRRPTMAKRVLPTAIALALLAPAAYTPMVFAQDDSDAQLEEIVVTGSRGRPRTVSDSPVPIDVFTSEDLRAVSYTDTNDILKTLVPSFNLGRQPISDGSSFIRPAEMRGLPTDKTLVLVNSKRRHRSALVSDRRLWYSGTGHIYDSIHRIEKHRSIARWCFGAVWL